MSVAVGETGPRFRALLAEGRWPPSVVWGSREPGCFFRGTSGVRSAVRAARPPPVQGEGGVSLHGPVQGRYSAEEARFVMLKSVRVGTGARCLQRKGRGGGCVTGPVRGAPPCHGAQGQEARCTGPSSPHRGRRDVAAEEPEQPEACVAAGRARVPDAVSALSRCAWCRTPCSFKSCSGLSRCACL